MITIGQTIYTLLTGNTAITGYTGLNIYPLIVPENTPLPLIVYERRSTNDASKDANALNNVDVDVMILADEYKESIDIAVLVASTLENYSNGTIKKIHFTNIDELYTDGVFIQKLTFNIKCY